MLKNKLIYLFVAIVTFVSLSACGGDSSSKSNDTVTTVTTVTADKSDTTAGLIEPEQLISKSETEGILGESVKEGTKKQQEVVGLKLCFYEAASDASGDFLQIGITQDAFMPKAQIESGTTSKFLFESIKKAFPDAPVVEGIGDSAFICSTGLNILKGDYYLTISIGQVDAGKKTDMLKKAGKLAIDNLDKLSK